MGTLSSPYPNPCADPVGGYCQMKQERAARAALSYARPAAPATVPSSKDSRACTRPSACRPARRRHLPRSAGARPTRPVYPHSTRHRATATAHSRAHFLVRELFAIATKRKTLCACGKRSARMGGAAGGNVEDADDAEGWRRAALSYQAKFVNDFVEGACTCSHSAHLEFALPLSAQLKLTLPPI
jgi:hypothetical protein